MNVCYLFIDEQGENKWFRLVLSQCETLKIGRSCESAIIINGVCVI